MAYLSGAVPYGLLFVRVSTGADIRQLGSGNIGATNVRRAAGNKWAVATLICDLLKGLVPTLAAVLTLNDSTCLWLPALTALAAVCGHMYPIYLGFKPSGKGVATAFGSLLPAAPWACLCAVTVFLIAARFSQRASVGSLAAVLSLPPAVWFTTRDLCLLPAALIIMILIMSRHKDNIIRLAQGREPSV